MTEDTDKKWPLNRPVSAHITIHYEDDERERAGKVVKTVLNIDQAGENDVASSLQGYSLEEACKSPTASPRDSRRPSNANSMNVYDFYQCVHRQRDSERENGSHSVGRRFSEPRIPNTTNQQHPRHLHCTQEEAPIVRSMSLATGMDPHLIMLPPLRKNRADERLSSRTSSRSSSRSSSGSEPSAEHRCLDLSCPCSRHHHRRNSVAVKFHKAMYKKA
ncbi:uncharacterized protein TDEL_0A07230 [Torulaspora delbrueckii]|uniref:Uncharacterized protein n=1 Tax=Torulaspora delbrueckii TaxID=4950 RepID=G8ZN61_TORDE|nr:hypothetical protein TDEL_0A07230 [Torulaspora delbrueckii]CCE90055.1 hypothetical protein TDEL_0A07230 [Torulaspora delbrueckii]